MIEPIHIQRHQDGTVTVEVFPQLTEVAPQALVAGEGNPRVYLKLVADNRSATYVVTGWDARTGRLQLALASTQEGGAR